MNRVDLIEYLAGACDMDRADLIKYLTFGFCMGGLTTFVLNKIWGI